MDATQHDELIDVNAVARMYGIVPGTVWHWLRAGRIPAPVKQRAKNYTRWLKSDVLRDIRTADIEQKAEAAS